MDTNVIDINTSKVDRKRTIIFLAFAFGIAWLTALVIALTGGLTNSPILVANTNISLAFVLTAVGYMCAPAAAHVLTRLITREGWKDLGLRLNFKRAWKYWLFLWFGPSVFVVIGGVLYFLVFPQQFDPSLSSLEPMLVGTDISPQTLVMIQTIQAFLIGPLLNGLFTFGEEFGWRSYLLRKLLPLGGRKAVLLVGVIWGLWHAPIIAMGHNYGLDYPGAPWLGILAMTLFCVALGIVFSWAAIKADSVWPAVIGHGAVNGFAGVVTFFVKGTPFTLLGPAMTGILSGLPLLILAAVIFFSKKGLEPAK